MLIALSLLLYAIVLPSQEITLQGKVIPLPMATPFTSNIFITIPICLGDRSVRQCVELIYDMNDKHFIVSDISNHPKGYNVSLSETKQKEDKTYSIGLGRKGTLSNTIYQESIYFDSEHILEKFNFLLTESISFSIKDWPYVGIAGFGYRSHLGSEYSFITMLYRNKIISNKNYGHRFINQKKVEIFIGEDKYEKDKSYMKSFSYCYMGQPLGETESNFYCRMEALSYANNNTVINTYTSTYVIFSTRTDGISAPNPSGYDLFNLYIVASRNKCSIQTDTFTDAHFVQCDPSFDVSTLPTVSLNMRESKVRIKIKPKDVFDLANKGRIFIRKYANNWILDLNILRYYDMHINYDKAGVGFREHGLFDNENLQQEKEILFDLILGLLFICLWGSGLIGYYYIITGDKLNPIIQMVL